MPVDELTARRGSNLGHSVSVALLLSAVAGFVDAFGYLVIFHIYTANMSGNSLGFAVSVANGDLLNAFQRGWPILGYVVGLILGSIIIQATRNRHVGWIMSICLTVEIIFLLTFLLLGISAPAAASLRPADVGRFALLIGFPTLAMGLQNVTLRKAGGVSIFTTHVTGTLTRMVEEATQFIFWLRRRLAHRVPGRFHRTLHIAPRQPSLRAANELFCLWLTYLIGGVAAVLARRRLGYFALFYPIGALIVAVIINLTRAARQNNLASAPSASPPV